MSVCRQGHPKQNVPSSQQENVTMGGATWPEQDILDKFFDLFETEAPREAIIKLKNDLTTVRLSVQEQKEQLERDVVSWMQAAESLAEEVDLETRMTSSNELVRKMAKQDFTFEEKLRWKKKISQFF